ncbi:hypothetical protein AB0F91_35200 [Amycolatopsis sp. NPDC023774]|uniref:hypothetical protein n=1 Tax=Amycolatopsis sp. NPDC023774 TaxID=3155015 RepID=UPI0033CECC3B
MIGSLSHLIRSAVIDAVLDGSGRSPRLTSTQAASTTRRGNRPAPTAPGQAQPDEHPH